MRNTETKIKHPGKSVESSWTYPSWNAYVQAKVDRANKRLRRMDLTKLFDEKTEKDSTE